MERWIAYLGLFPAPIPGLPGTASVKGEYRKAMSLTFERKRNAHGSGSNDANIAINIAGRKFGQNTHA
jgi:hypothetical protein